MVHSRTLMASRPRVVIALPDVAESAAIADWLSSEGFDCVRRLTVRGAAAEMQARAFDLLITDLAFAFADGLHRMGRSRNPTTPTVVIGDMLAPAECEAARWAMYVPRPVDYALLICTVSMAILDGRPLRRSARKIVNRFSAFVNGTPAHIIDISNEGVRLELPRDGRAVLPPHFTVRVPLLGVGVRVQRMWARPWRGHRRPEVMWCGGALAENPGRAEDSWRAFVDTLPVAGSPRTDSIRIQ
jgi:DNA-binding NarL/FixJ family response regulator